MFPLFKTTESLLPLILGVAAFSMWARKIKFFRNVGPAMTCVVLGIIIANLKIVPPWADVYGTIMQYGVPAAISLFLMSMDLSRLRRMTAQPAAAMFCAVFCVSLVAVVFGTAFGRAIPEGWKVAGMFVGTYTGGSANLTAIAVGLEAAQDTIAAANAADYVVGIPTMLLMFAAPALFAKSKWLQKKWPYRFTAAEYQEGDAEPSLMAEQSWSIVEIAILLTLAFAIVALCTLVSGLIFPPSFASAGRVLMISTLSILGAQVPPVRKLRGKLNLGMFFSLMFLVVIGFLVDLAAFLGSTISLTLFCLCVILTSIILHMLLMRIFKIKYEYMVLSITAAIADGSTAALVAVGGDWKNLIGLGILMGTIGSLAGNYAGIGVAYIVKALLDF